MRPRCGATRLRLTGQDRARAEDVVQETLLRAWRNHDRLDESRGSVRSWLFTVARNIVIDEWRTSRSQHEVAVAEVPEGRDEVDHTDQLLTSWLVAEASPRCRRTTGRCCSSATTAGPSVAQAAHRLGIPEGTVKSRTHYALRALRLALAGDGGGRMTCRFAHLDGAYVLGSLSPAERLEFEAHLPGCAECSRGVRELAGLPGPAGPGRRGRSSRCPRPTPRCRRPCCPRCVREVRGEQRRRSVLTARWRGRGGRASCSGRSRSAGAFDGRRRPRR